MGEKVSESPLPGLLPEVYRSKTIEQVSWHEISRAVLRTQKPKRTNRVMVTETKILRLVTRQLLSDSVEGVSARLQINFPTRLLLGRNAIDREEKW